MQSHDQEPTIPHDALENEESSEEAVATAVPSPTGASAKETALYIAKQAALAGQGKNATHIQIIDVDGRVDYADYLVLMTGSSDRNVAAIAQAVEMELKAKGHRASAVEGLPSAEWVLIDFFDVVVHVFQADWRSEYDLDGLWADADRVAF